MSFIKNGLTLPYQKVDTNLGIEHVYTIPKDFKYMSEVFNTLPDNSFLCKSVAGVGGTSLAINNSEDYVIAVGSVELIINKSEQHENLIPVYSGVNSCDIMTAIESKKLSGQPVKIIVTYDSLPKVVESLGADVANTKILVDELQVLLKASDTFKPVVVTKLFNLVGSFKSVCFMTATPTPRKYFPPEVEKLDYIRLEWEGSSVMHIKKAKMKGDVTSKVVAIALNHLDNEGTPLFFYNSLRGIVPCVKQLIKARGLTHKDVKIICANSERNRAYLKEQLGEEWIPERPLYKEVDEGGNVKLNPRNKPIQFCTKYAFEGLDFCVEDAHTYIISDVKNRSRHHTRIDISTDIQQIAGRCRNQNPLIKREAVFLWNDEFVGISLSEDEYEECVKKELAIAKDMEQRYSLEQLKNSIGLGFNSSPYFLEIDGKAQTNDYAVYGLCISYAALNADYVNVMVDGEKSVLEEKLELFSETDSYTVPDIKLEDMVKMDRKLNFKELAMEYYEISEQQKVCQDSELDERLEVLLSLDGEFKSYVEVLGIEQIKATHFHKTKTRAKYNKAVGIDEKSKEQIKALKSLKVKHNTFYNFAELKEMIKSAYTKLGVNASAKATDIQSAYLVKSTSRNGVRGYLIVGKV